MCCELGDRMFRRQARLELPGTKNVFVLGIKFRLRKSFRLFKKFINLWNLIWAGLAAAEDEKKSLHDNAIAT